MDEKKLQELFSNEAFVNSLLEMDTAQEVQAALQEKGISLTLEEIEAIRKQLQSGAVAEQELDNVAGGAWEYFEPPGRTSPEVFVDPIRSAVRASWGP